MVRPADVRLGSGFAAILPASATARAQRAPPLSRRSLGEGGSDLRLLTTDASSFATSESTSTADWICSTACASSRPASVDWPPGHASTPDDIAELPTEHSGGPTDCECSLTVRAAGPPAARVCSPCGRSSLPARPGPLPDRQIAISPKKCRFFLLATVYRIAKTASRAPALTAGVHP